MSDIGGARRASHPRLICSKSARTSRDETPLAFTVAPERTLSVAGDVYPDLGDVRGQAHAKRAVEIAAAGGHSLLFMESAGRG